ncbi:hypothetical protein [Rhodopila sp.]|uniref:hypothetical protein n=1 Tax=Rhodopila sp. TaxID=2480087 RepID=UPI003D138966
MIALISESAVIHADPVIEAEATRAEYGETRYRAVRGEVEEDGKRRYQAILTRHNEGATRPEQKPQQKPRRCASAAR